MNEVAVPEADRRSAEDRYFRWVQTRDRADPKQPEGRPSISIGPDGIHVTPGVGAKSEDDPHRDVSSLIRQRRQPEFIEAAYVLRLSFDGGRYAPRRMPESSGKDTSATTSRGYCGCLATGRRGYPRSVAAN